MYNLKVDWTKNVLITNILHWQINCLHNYYKPYLYTIYLPLTGNTNTSQQKHKLIDKTNKKI